MEWRRCITMKLLCTDNRIIVVVHEEGCVFVGRSEESASAFHVREGKARDGSWRIVNKTGRNLAKQEGTLQQRKAGTKRSRQRYQKVAACFP
jgi:hypothetical protein